ncbi:tRNA pseudouridine(38-40) synthase TruA [Candidatus Finniella inopinata]|uniref:tRNA pseudouridine synthase A n=1 Tax=Candidatus Finniella inopinata TaxID=1696036 RepID=A0A4Q7DHP7_9PROT|nr:tRNA pseudouridine(38-40) synthase TruA [Candidatus Finniella inopinata]RZI45870.1 tRNA pseudouridine(38-40) synthase TruA [Candidatus Finniella inopinata]
MPSFHRYKITIEYNGACFHGWQRQTNPLKGDLITVQGALEKAFLKLTKQQTLVEGAGRTDAGVHATGQVCHCDMEKYFPPLQLRDALNFYLQDQGVSVLEVEEVDHTFHARFSATLRTYHYHIINRRPPLALESERAWHVKTPLDAGLMQQAAQELVGHYDFSAFRAAECQGKSPMKTLSRFDVAVENDRIVAIIASRSFLHNQVRIMMGTLKRVGEGKWTREDVIRIRDSKQRPLSGPTAPAHGLYLTGVQYD